MDKTVIPTVAFAPAVASTLTLNVGMSSWNAAGTVYTSVYDVADADVEDSVTGKTSGGKDLAGNLQNPDSSASFDIDTKNPTVTTTAPDSLINDADVGTGTF